MCQPAALCLSSEMNYNSVDLVQQQPAADLLQPARRRKQRSSACHSTAAAR